MTTMGRCFGAAGLALTLLVGSGQVQAGGYDTGERNWDAVFDAGPVSLNTQVRVILPNRKLRNVTNVNPFLPGTTASVAEAESFAVFRGDLSFQIAEPLRCLGSFRQPFVGHANYGMAWVASASAIEQHFSSRDIGLTCAAAIPVERGRIGLLGGISYQHASYELTQLAGLAGVRTTAVEGGSTTWRAGVFYEIADYALRVSLIYDAPVHYNMSGTVSLPALGPPVPVTGSLTMPQSVELRAQSGIAPGWLAFGSARWTDWSVADRMPLCPAGTPVCTQAVAISGLELQWKDSWTVTAGAVRQFADWLAVSGSLTWDQGASAGFTSQTDTWVAGFNAIVTPSENMQVIVGGTVGLMTGGTLSTAQLGGGAPNPVGYTAQFGDDVVFSLNAALKATF